MLNRMLKQQLELNNSEAQGAWEKGHCLGSCHYADKGAEREFLPSTLAWKNLQRATQGKLVELTN